MLAPVLIACLAAAVVAFVVRRAFRTRRVAAGVGSASAARRLGTDITFMAFGVVMMVVSLIVAHRLLAVKEPPRGEVFPAA